MDSNGAAVAYVGNTRYGWIGIGHEYEEKFWSGLKLSGRVGPAVASRWTLGLISTWLFYAENLFGDPEMPVWTNPPEHQVVIHQSSVRWGDSFKVYVKYQGLPAAGHRIIVMGGWTDSAQRPRILQSKITEHTGVATFQLPSSTSSVSELTVTVTKKGFKPYIGNIQVLPAPVGWDQSVVTGVNMPVEITLQATSLLFCEIVEQPENGTLSNYSCHFSECTNVHDHLSPAKVTYEPAPSFRGDDSFTYKIRTLRGVESNITTVSISVL